MSPNAPQPAPKAGTGTPTWQLVIDDMIRRDVQGEQKYARRHQHDNGRDHLVDLYQELLDACCYVRAEIERRRHERNRVAALELALRDAIDLAGAIDPKGAADVVDLDRGALLAHLHEALEGK